MLKRFNRDTLGRSGDCFKVTVSICMTSSRQDGLLLMYNDLTRTYVVSLLKTTTIYNKITSLLRVVIIQTVISRNSTETYVTISTVHNSNIRSQHRFNI